jgi:tetratricopeptide (TPR) repeat protein
LFEAPSALAAATSDGICGDEAFYEHVHFKYGGSYHLGRAWAEQVENFLPGEIKNRAAGPWASQALCERRLALTDWNRRNDLGEIAGRRHAAPLSGQSNNAQQLAALQAELAALNQRMDAADATQARQICLEAIEHAPQDMDLHGNFADFLEAIGDPKQAAEQWREVQRLLPQYYMGYFQEGRMLERMGQLDQARAAFNQTIALRPAMAPAWFELGNIDASEGKLDLALQEVDCARQRQPHQPAYYACMGRLLSRLNRHADAVERYRQALQVDTNYWDGRIALGEELAATGNLAEAQTEFESGVKLRPDSARAHLDLGVTFARQGRPDAAQHELEEALRLEPGNKQAQETLHQIQPTRAGRP